MKKKRSAKQKANDRRLGRMAKERGQNTKSKPKKKKKSTRKYQVRKTARRAYVKKKTTKKRATDPWLF
jgi:hypothetical protein